MTLRTPMLKAAAAAHGQAWSPMSSPTGTRTWTVRGGLTPLDKARKQTLDELARAATPAVTKMLAAQLGGVLSAAQLVKLAAGVRAGRQGVVAELLPVWTPKHPGPWKSLADAYRKALLPLLAKAGQASLDALGVKKRERLAKGFSFRVDNPYTTRWLNEQTGALIKDISDSARANIKNLVAQAWTDGIPPRELAQLIRPHIGLTTPQAEAVERRFNATVDELLDGGMDKEEALATAAERLSPYAEDLLAQRAETIARTETIAASTAAAHDAWSDAKDQGLLPDNVQREWTASPEGKGACPYCVDLDGARVGFDEPFETDIPGRDGTVDRPPLHPRCRCAVRLILPGLNDSRSLDELRAFVDDAQSDEE